jgi:hypothetical protein
MRAAISRCMLIKAALSESHRVYRTAWGLGSADAILLR